MQYNLNAVLNLRDNMTAHLRQAISNIRNTNNQARTMGDTFRRTGQQATDSMNNTAGATREAENATRNANNSISSLVGTIGKLTGVATGIATVKKSFSAMFDSASSMEMNRATLETFMNTAEEAGQKIAWAKEFANKTPFETQDVVSGLVKLKSYGADISEENMTRLGNMAGAMGKSYDQAVEAIADAQTGELERLKEFGITKQMIVDQNDKVLHGKQIVNQKGQIIDQEQFNKALYSLMDARFKGGMERQAKTAKGMISTTKGMISNMLAVFGGIDDAGNIIEGGLLDTVKGVITQINDKFNELNENGTIKEWADKFSNGIKTIVANKDKIIPALMAITGIMGAFKIKGIIDGFTGLSGAMSFLNGTSTRLLPVLNNIFNPLQWIKNAFKGLISLPSLVAGGFTKIGGVIRILGTSFLHPLTSIKKLGTLGKTAFRLLRGGISSVLSPATIVIGIIALVVGAVVHLWNTNESFRNRMTQIWEGIKTAIGMAIDGICQIIGKIKIWLDQHQQQVKTFKAVIGLIWEGICTAIGIAVETIGTIILGIATFISDVVGIIQAIIDCDWGLVWERCKETVQHAIDQIKEWWNGLKELISHPIDAVVNFVKGGDSEEVGHNAKGTNNWRGGLTWINEEGGELVNLPNGAQIIPHDLSKRMIDQKAKNSTEITNSGSNNGFSGVNIHIENMSVRNDSDIEAIGQSLFKQIKLASMKG